MTAAGSGAYPEFPLWKFPWRAEFYLLASISPGDATGRLYFICYLQALTRHRTPDAVDIPLVCS
jgi:hypothetical protein